MCEGVGRVGLLHVSGIDLGKRCWGGDVEVVLGGSDLMWRWW